MARSGGIIHSKLPPQGEFFVRDTNAPIRSADTDQEATDWVVKGFRRMQEALDTLATHIENRSFPVDEYNTVPITGAATESVVSVLPTYEYMPEKIEAIVVTGPANAVCTLLLGDRQWPIVIPAAGILPIGPLAIILGRSDPRQLIAQTAGIYTLELMGVADRRYDIT